MRAASLLIAVIFVGGISASGRAAEPPSLADIQAAKPVTALAERSPQIRSDALSNAALSYGMRAGLAARTFVIAHLVQGQTAALDALFDFRAFSLPGPGGTLLDPPIASEAIDAITIAEGGQSTAVANRVLGLIRNAELVAVPKNWREYLILSWELPDPPHDTLLPRTDQERELWRSTTERGWRLGQQQADDTFREDLARLERDFRGIILFRTLVARDMAQMPWVDVVDRGVTGNASSVRIGDREIRIMQPGRLEVDPTRWGALPQ